MHNRWQRVPMAKGDSKARSHDFSEVALGYNEREAVKEASRCLLCPTPQCIKGCPVGIDIRSFIKLIKEKQYFKAALKIKEKNSLPAICGRVCPQEDQCQKFCALGKKGDPISIGNLERFVADFEWKRGVEIPVKAVPTGKKVAVVGAGPAGLTVAAELSKLGHQVTIFEALHVAGGVLIYGIPEFRLPKNIVTREVEYIEKLGVDIHTDALIGRLFTIEELLENGFQAVFVGTGAGLPQFLGIPGENLTGIYSANEFLIRVNLMRSFKFPSFDTPISVGKRVAVIGGGNVAIDSARTALRLGAECVSIVYRRSRREMPARKDEIVNAEEEGVKFHYLVSPSRFFGDEKGRVKAMEYFYAKLGKPDRSGRRKPIPIPGSTGTMDVDTVVVAIGRTPNPIIQNTTKGLEVTKHGIIVIEDATGETSINGVYAGGDITTGEATVISAMGAGKKAANSIHTYLNINSKPSQISTALEVSNQITARADPGLKR
ncbi:MAG: NADPH-dependent glutamate synthase [Candidatus Bathyarchaeota archaeon]|nr:NADPH-dependent glutamate synthase [Candidatus Bathyarchaeota archaeon]